MSFSRNRRCYLTFTTYNCTATVFTTTNMATDPGDPRALPDKTIFNNEQQKGPLRLGNSDSEFTLIKERTTTSTALGSIQSFIIGKI